MFKLAQIKWFQVFFVMACSILFLLLAGSVFFSYQRRSGITGLDAGDIQQIRDRVSKAL